MPSSFLTWGHSFQGEIAHHSPEFLPSGVREVSRVLWVFLRKPQWWHCAMVMVLTLWHYLWGKFGKGYNGISLYYFLQFHGNLQISQKHKLNSKKKKVPTISLTERDFLAYGFHVPAFGATVHRNAEYPNSPCSGNGHVALEKCPAPTDPCTIDDGLHWLGTNALLLSIRLASICLLPTDRMSMK